MAKKITIILLTVVIILSAVMLCACTEPTVKKVTIRQNSFLSNYAIDSVLSLSGAFITVTYSDGSEIQVQITHDMVEGFDSSTTGQKKMRINYQGVYSEDIEYLIYNPENAATDILTSTRLVLSAGKNLSFAEYTVSLKYGDLEKITGVTFTLKSSEGFDIKDAEDVLYFNSLPDGWHYDYSLPTDTEIRVVAYCIDERNISSDSTVINIMLRDKDVVSSPKLTAITVSDGKNDFTLPSAS